jgi:phosphoserine aminotransferase
VFRLRDPAQEPAFVERARAAGIDGLSGHRSVGGFRVSMYTAMPVHGAELVAGLLEEHAARAGSAGA